MATGYHALDLRDIIGNQRTRTVLPMISSVTVNRYKPNYFGERTKSGRQRKTIAVKTQSDDYKLIVLEQIRHMTRRVARPYYSPLSVTRSGGDINVSGTLKISHSTAYHRILEGWQATSRKSLLENMATNSPIIQEVFKQIKNDKSKQLDSNAEDFKVYVRAASVSEIAHMNSQQIARVEQDIIDSIVFGKGFLQVKKALGFDQELFMTKWKNERVAWTNKVSKT